MADLIFCEINGIERSIYSAISEEYSGPSHTSKIERFMKIVNG